MYPNTDYATDARFKIDLIIDQLAAKEMSIARYYMKTEKWIPALNRLKIVVDQYDKTIFVEEALHRLVEIYYRLGLLEEAKRAASILGYNYRSGDWYLVHMKEMLDNGQTKGIKNINSTVRDIEYFTDAKGIPNEYSADTECILITTDEYVVRMGQNDVSDYYPSNFFDLQECKDFALGIKPDNAEVIDL